MSFVTPVLVAQIICFHIVALKLAPLDSRLNMMLTKLSFTATPNIKQLLCVIFLLFMIFLVLVAVQITLAKQEESYKKALLNVVGLIITVLLQTSQRLHMCPTFVWYCVFAFVNFLRHHYPFKTVTNLI